MKIDLANGAEITPLLRNSKWRKVVHYDIECLSEAWGSAIFLQLDKAVTASAQVALLYMLERYAIDENEWTDEGYIDLRGAQFLDLIFSEGYISDPKGWEFSVAEFWENFCRIREGMRNEMFHQLARNNVEIPDQPLLEKEDIIAVHCFADVWNESQYLIETTNSWAFFNWGTSA